jgi:hypothetical protein
MKRTLFTLATMALVMLVMSCGSKDAQHGKMVSGDKRDSLQANVVKDTTRWTKLEWINDKFDFGTVPEAGQIEVSFKFKNTGEKDLLILSVEKTCGCTETQKPEGFIKPGEEGVIKAKYNTEGRPGKAEKMIHVVCNTAESPYNLTFTGTVTPKKNN